MHAFKRLPGTHREPAGFEWTLFRRLPLLAVSGSLLGALYALTARIAHDALPSDVMHTSDIVAIAFVMALWSVALLLAIGCGIVIVMKGPGYVADAYLLPDREPASGGPVPIERRRFPRPKAD